MHSNVCNDRVYKWPLIKWNWIRQKTKFLPLSFLETKSFVVLLHLQTEKNIFVFAWKCKVWTLANQMDLIFHQIVTILTLHMIIPRFLAEAVFRLLINRQKHFKTLWGRRNIMTFWISLCRIPQDKHSLRICFNIFCKVSTISKLEKSYKYWILYICSGYELEFCVIW